MTRLRIATFNVENMFRRFPFAAPADRPEPPADSAAALSLAELADRVEWRMLDDENRTCTALALRDLQADIVCLQEVEDLPTLRLFNERYVARIADIEYRHALVIEGNDRRGIDVGLLSRHAVDWAATHQHVTYADLNLKRPGAARSDRVFQRDCLEAHFRLGRAGLALYVCHFKSMNAGRSSLDGRRDTRPLREAEALAVRRAIEARFPDPAAADWLVAGDLNDYTEADGAPDAEHALRPLLEDGFAVDLAKRIADPYGRWTHFYGEKRMYRQLDYLLASPALARKNREAVPEILRAGQPFRAMRFKGHRYPRIGWDRPKASDHCPMVVELTL